MKKLALSLVAAGGLFAACTTSPSAPTVSFTAPVANGPSNGATYKFKSQPVTIVLTNTAKTGSATATYAVEVATDAGFANRVFTQDGIAEGGGGTTPVTINSLPASNGDVTYYWHSWAIVDGVPGPPSPTQTFVVQQQIVVNTPSVSSPGNGGTASDTRPTFVTQNTTHKGAVSSISYLFQVSKTSDFSSSSILTSGSAQEQSGGTTSWRAAADLPTGDLFWRVQAKDDGSGETSGFSSSARFTLQPFDPTQATFLNGPGDVGSWPETARITLIQFNDDALIVDFDKRTGGGSWPEAGFGTDGGIQYTLGMCYKLEKWYCSAPIQFWAGRDLEAAGAPSLIPELWYYDPARWGPMSSHRAADGETVAIYVAQGNLRGPGGNTYRERSNFVLLPFGTNYSAH